MNISRWNSFDTKYTYNRSEMQSKSTIKMLLNYYEMRGALATNTNIIRKTQMR